VGTAAHKFVVNHVKRRRPRTPGCEMGQELVLAHPSSTLGEVSFCGLTTTLTTTTCLLARHHQHKSISFNLLSTAEEATGASTTSAQGTCWLMSLVLFPGQQLLAFDGCGLYALLPVVPWYTSVALAVCLHHYTCFYSPRLLCPCIHMLSS
jgi:hypothetical protein